LLAAHKSQNHPQLYGEIVRLCRRGDMITHFSNIIGFPEDTEAGIRGHLEALTDIAPDVASFYILTPIPGTQQYDEFLAAGLITERNLDRFDGTNPTWRHDVLEPKQLQDMLFRCYKRFYDLSHLIRYCFGGRKTAIASGIASHIFHRFAAFRRMHPMSGGIGRVFRDGIEDYRALRQRRFGFDLLPLPTSLQLSAEDAALNSRARVS
jgi:radical SAM superfamily enzyme YgiQ (UPF0313 family)